MPRKIAQLLVCLTVAQFSGSACALKPISSDPEHCRVIGAEMLPSAVADPETLCEAIDAAAREHAPRAPFAVEVRVLSPSKLAAVVTLKDGRKLPEQKIAVSDSAIQHSSIERFADAIAKQVAEAVGC